MAGRATDPATDPTPDTQHDALIVPIDSLDLSTRLMTRRELERLIPHRDAMMLLDGIIWRSDDGTMAVGVKHVRGDEFWVPGHFPGKPMFPGVLMVETGAQLAAFVWNSSQPEPQLAAFLRLENTVFRKSVVPGDELLVLCKEVKRGRRRFESDVQGVVRNEIAFEARITGMAMGPFRGTVE